MTIGRIPSVEGGIQPTIVDAKGDLIAATAADTVNRLAVGSNDQVLVADSSTSTGLAWKSYGLQTQNPVINSAFQVWQRGTSLGGNGNYTADRWYAGVSAAGRTVSRQLTNDTTNLPNIQYCLRFQRDSGNTNTSVLKVINNFETIDSIPFAGKTVTLSFYARAGANFSSSSSILKAYVVTGTGTDQNQDSGFTGQATPINQNATLTTTWQRFSYTGTIATTATQIAIRFDYTPVGTAGAADFFEVTGVQLEEGSTATPYRTYSATLQGELAACMRYYQRVTGSTITAGICGSTTISYFTYASQVPFRKTTLSLTQAGYGVSDFSGGYWDTGTIAISGNAEDAIGVGRVQLTYTHGTAVFTQYRPCLLAPGGSTSYLAISAEL